mgnify:CR=1 FL=1
MTLPKRKMDTIGNQDLVPPELKLIQNIGSDDAKALGAQPGDFFCPMTSEIYKDGLDIVIVDMQKTRTYWGRSEIDNAPPDCSSSDADSLMSMDGKSCADCKLRCDTPWLVDVTERRQLCLIHYNLLTINYDSGMPLVIRASGISTLPVRELLTALRLNRQIKGEYHRIKVRLISEKKKTSSGEGYALRFLKPTLITEKEKAEEMSALTYSLIGLLILPPQEVAMLTELAEEPKLELKPIKETKMPDLSF